MAWILTIVTFFLGLASALGIAFGTSQIERWQGRKDRADDFQRQPLLDLQDTLYALARTMGAIHHHDKMAFRQTEQWGDNLLPDDLNLQENQAKIRINTLVVRVENEDARQLVESFRGAATRILIARTENDAVTAFDAMLESHKSVNAKIGELLRSL